MSALRKLTENLSDLTKFGPTFLLRHIAKLTGIVSVHIPPVGKLYIRGTRSDAITVRQIFGSNHLELGQTSHFGKGAHARYQEILSLGKKPVIIDAGANIGAAAIWFSARYPDAVIIAVEPELGNLDVLRRNAHERPNIIVQASAIGSKPGFASVSGYGAAAQTVRSDKGVQIISMQDAFKLVDDGIPFIAKVDIEGFEKDLFSSNLEWLD